MQKKLLISICAILFISHLNYVFANFNDVSSVHSNSEAINYVQSQNIVSGYDDDTFKPDNTINRAEFTKIIIGANFSQNEIDTCISDNSKPGWTYMFFPDVPINEWYAKYICVAKMNDVIKGYDDGTFKPDNQINFAESAKIIVNAFKYSVITDPVWYKPFAEKLSAQRAIPTSIVYLDKFITRGEMAEMVYRLKAGVTNKESMYFEGEQLIFPAYTSSDEPSVAPATSEPSVITGGACSYDEFPGKCKITSIQKTPESIKQINVSGGPGYEGYDITYLYSPNNEPSDNDLKFYESEIFHLLMDNKDFYIGPEFIKKYNINVNNVYDCKLELITIGTCNPSIIRFTDKNINLKDYFEIKSAPSPTPTPSAPVTSAYTPTYYVGKTSCSDTGSGTRTQPFCKVQTGLNKLKAGDVLMILNGTYKERIYLQSSGTQGNPIVVTGESATGAILDAGCPSFPCPYNQIGTFPLWEGAGDNISGFVINNQNYITLDGFTMQNTPDNGIEANTTTGLTIKNMNVKNSVASLVNIYDSKDLKVFNNTLNGSHMGRISLNGNTIQITPEEAMSIVNTDGFDIYNNSLSDGMKEGITLKVGSKNGKVHNNDIKRLCAVGIYVDEGSYIDIYENTISDVGFITKDGTVKRCDDVITGTVKFEGAIDGEINTYDANAYEQGTGIMMATGDIGDLAKGKVTDVKIYKNIIKDNNVGCVSIWDQIRDSGSGQTGSLENIQIYNNDIYNCARSKANWGPGVIVSPSAKVTKIWNNIFMLTSEAIDNQGANTDISNNLFYEAGGTMGTSPVESNPMFTNAGTGDFKLKSGSPAIDKGKNAGLPFNGSAPDIGAIEY